MKGVGSLVFFVGLGLAGVCVLTPTKPLGSTGFYRDTFKGTTYLNYGSTSGRGTDFYFARFGSVVGLAATALAVGGVLVALGRALRRSSA